jgi:hypothetical protein
LTLNDSAQVLARKFLRGRWLADERWWPVKLTEILIAVVAAYGAILSTYGAILSTINLRATIRAKRWHVAVSYWYFRTIDYGGGKPFLLGYRAINLGERDVALKSFTVEVMSEKNNFFRHALNITTGRRGYSRFFTPVGILKCEPTLPLLLQPGRECVVTVDQTRLFDMFHFSWIARVRGVFEDETGNCYKSPTAKVDWQSRIIT